MTVSARPTAQVGCMSSPMRAAARSASPAAWACSSALSAMPFAWYQDAARRWSSGRSTGSSGSSATSSSRKRWWTRYHLSSSSIGWRKRFWRVGPMEPPGRVGGLEHGVTQRGGEPIEDRGPDEELDLLAGQRVEHLGAEVLREVRVAAVRSDGRPSGGARLHRERGEVQVRPPSPLFERSAPRPGRRAGRYRCGGAARRPPSARGPGRTAPARRGDRCARILRGGPPRRRAGGHEQAMLLGKLCIAIWVTMSNASGLVTASAWSMASVNGSRLLHPRVESGHHRVGRADGPPAPLAPRAEGGRSGRGRPPPS